MYLHGQVQRQLLRLPTMSASILVVPAHSSESSYQNTGLIVEW